MDNKLLILHFPYSEKSLSSCQIPKHRLSKIYEMNKVKPTKDLALEVERAVKNPIGTKSLQDMMSTGKKVALLVDDLTRPTPAHLILPFVLKEIHLGGVKKEDISIIMAIGSHRVMTEQELRQKLGADIVEEYNVFNSRFDDPDHLVNVGKSEDGVTILIDEEVINADIKIGIGSIVPHAALGWSGGGKIIYPGVAGKETVMHFHYTHGLTEANLTGQEETVVRTRMEDWVQHVGLDFIVNCVLTPDDEVYRVVAGHYIKAHRQGVKLGKVVYCKQIQEKTDLVIAVSYTHDHNFWQATKGIYSSEPLVKDGGTLLLVSPCYEGLGMHPTFPERIGDDTNKERILKILAGETLVPDDPLPLAPAAMLAQLRKRIHCAVVSPGVIGTQMEQAHYEKFPDVQSAVNELLTRYPDGKISVVMRSDVAFYE